MVSESCKVFVKRTLKELDIKYVKVELGEIETKEEIFKDDKEKLNLKIKKVGLELLEKKQRVLIDKMKNLMIEYVNMEVKPNVSFSIYLSEELGNSYTYLSKIFSEIEDTTVEKYLIALKVEKIKELIIFGEYNISEIAYILHYSSVAHLSAQFKKVTGQTPSYFKALKDQKRVPIENIQRR